MSKVIRHVTVLLAVCIAAVIMTYVMGHFMELHPDAYRDIVRSILMVYALVLLIGGCIKLLSKVPPIQGAMEKATTWFGETTPLQAISEGFLMITAVNNVMMLTGIDVPKQGVFAYVHMLSRILIITIVVVALMWRDVLARLKTLKPRDDLHHFFQNAHRHVFASASQVFTLVTVIYCAAAILASRMMPIKGGATFYVVLLILMGLSFAGVIALRTARKT
jgi:hypothetical protein